MLLKRREIAISVGALEGASGGSLRPSPLTHDAVAATEQRLREALLAAVKQHHLERPRTL